MVISALPNSVLSSPRSDNAAQTQGGYPPGNAVGAAADDVSLSDIGRRLLEDSRLPPGQALPAYVSIPANERPSPQQSADVILGFIDQGLQRLARDGASRERLEDALQQALKGFQQGLKEARDILSGLGALSEDISAGINRTEQLVLDGLERLRANYLPEQAQTPRAAETDTPETNAGVSNAGVSSVVQAYSEQRTDISDSFIASNYSGFNGGGQREIGALAASYAQSYQRNQSVDLQVKTLDGDIIKLSFSSQLASDNRSVFAASATAGGAAAVLAYQRNASVSNSFSFSVQGDLDSGELDALNNLLQQVGELSDEFFNGDFDTAFALATAFQMDSSEFSALSLDLARSTRASVVASYVASDISTAPTAAIGNLSSESLVEQLLAMLEQASQFADSEILLTELVSNQLAQNSLLADRALLDLA